MDVQPHLLNLSAYINQNLEKDLPLSILAKRVGLSPFHFHRKFGAYFGESLHQHIKRLRLERAAFALVHGSAPVRQIARESGYKTVSAFSHAFSGFAGESPTRYRTQASSERSDGVVESSDETSLEPAWIGELAPQDFVFVRAMSDGENVSKLIGDTVALVLRLVGPLDGSDVQHGATPANPLTAIAATSDIYGISKGEAFRIDVGVDASRVRGDRVSLLGRQTLPGGRYARYDIHSPVADIAERSGGISLRELQRRGETPRLSQYFVRFSEQTDTHGDGEYQFFVPLMG